VKPTFYFTGAVKVLRLLCNSKAGGVSGVCILIIEKLPQRLEEEIIFSNDLD
jgi:hypothetical protein